MSEGESEIASPESETAGICPETASLLPASAQRRLAGRMALVAAAASVQPMNCLLPVLVAGPLWLRDVPVLIGLSPSLVVPKL